MFNALSFSSNKKNSLFFSLPENPQVTDDKSIQRRMILTTFTKKTKVMMFTGCVPLKLSNTWVHININLAKLINDLFGTIYVETVKIKVSV